MKSNKNLAAYIALAAALISPTHAAPANVLPNGDFEKPIDASQTNWSPAPNPNFQIVSENGNHFAVLTNADPGYHAQITALVPIDPAWKQVDVSARMKVKHLVLGQESWQSARVTTQFLDANKQILNYAGSSTLWSDTDWVTRTLRDGVPANAKYLSVQTGVWGPAGELSVDDIQVIPNPTFSAPPFPSSFDGSFEKAAHGDPVDVPISGTGWNLASEAGNHFLRTIVTVAGMRPEIRLNYTVPAAWHTVTVSARLRGKNIKVGASPGQIPHIDVNFLDSSGNLIYPLQPSPLELVTDTDWGAKTGTFTVPGNAKFFSVRPVMLNCVGQFDIDDLKIGSGD